MTRDSSVRLSSIHQTQNHRDSRKMNAKYKTRNRQINDHRICARVLLAFREKCVFIIILWRQWGRRRKWENEKYFGYWTVFTESFCHIFSIAATALQTVRKTLSHSAFSSSENTNEMTSRKRQEINRQPSVVAVLFMHNSCCCTIQNCHA